MTARRLWGGVLWLSLLAACAPISPTLMEPPTATATLAPLVTSTPTPAALPVEATSSAVLPDATAPSASTSDPTYTEHTVAPGDTLLALAIQYSVPMAAIQLANGLGAETGIRAGQTLAIPPASDWPNASPFWVVHSVAAGETLSAIAQRYQIGLATLRTVNGLSDADWIGVGQSLVIPLTGPSEARAQTEPVLPTAPPAPTAAPPTSTDPPEASPTEEPPLPTATPQPAPPPPPGEELTAWVQLTFDLVNAERAAHGLPPYTYNATLAYSAQLHAADCQQRGYCSHTGSDGSSIRERILRVGYPAAGWAECFVSSRDPAAAVGWWMDEVPPNDWHRRTILSEWLTEIGIAIVSNDRGSYYFIANFGRPQ